MRLYHYTCKHVASRLTRRAMLRPFPQLFGNHSLIWLTDQTDPDADGLGLTRNTLTCDRTEVRYVVETEQAEPWLTSQARQRLTQREIATLENGRHPEHWFIARQAVLAVRDRGYDQPRSGCR